MEENSWKIVRKWRKISYRLKTGRVLDAPLQAIPQSPKIVQIHSFDTSKVDGVF